MERNTTKGGDISLDQLLKDLPGRFQVIEDYHSFKEKAKLNSGKFWGGGMSLLESKKEKSPQEVLSAQKSLFRKGRT